MGKSSEDYLEAIYLLSGTTASVRSVDIARELGFSKPSVSIALKKLRAEGLIMMNGSGHIALTERGDQLARRVWDRHKTIYSWLRAMGVSEECAESDACGIEHIISEETFTAMQRALVAREDLR
ncbi:MAG: metal-dependent transcriptional regulator [Clostridiales bacterium]|nr:metal-dependent transcriptional regulator [Clostridiales bacterium]